MSASTRPSPKNLSGVLLLVLLIGFAPARAEAQANVEALQGAQFDVLAPGARSLGMGGAFVAVADDATAALANPAGLTQLPATEVSVEGRFRNALAPFVSGGRLSGQPTNIGLDTVATPVLDEASEWVNGLSFASVVFAGPQRSWAIAGYRHETLKFRSAFESQGAFLEDTTTPGTSLRYFPINATSDLTIVNYGVSGAAKFGVVSVGGGLSIYDLSIDSVTNRFNLPTGPAFFGPVTMLPSNQVNRQTLADGGTGLGFNVGILAVPTSRVQVGFAYRHGANLSYTATNEPGPLGTFQAYSQPDPEFAMPHVTTAGIAVRPAATTLVSFDYSHVRYSRIGEHFTDVFFAPQIDPTDVDQGPTFSIDDANEVHIGFEHQFVNASAAPALRLGAWFDPAHYPTTTGQDQLLFGALADAADDVWHYSVGGGVTLGPAVISGAIDFSDRGNIASTSVVFRFP